jgi:hypothetical protein
MLILGDILAIVASVIGIGVSAWALTICMGYLFSNHAGSAARSIQKKPWLAVGLGLATLLTIGLLSIILLSVPNPAVKFAGTLSSGFIVLTAFLGNAGMARIMGEKIRAECGCTDYAAFTKGAGLLVAACMFPVFGWFVLGPILFIMSLGAGITTLLTKHSNAPAYDI